MTESLLPQFLVVGAAKSGTTSLFHYLNRHPDIFIPPRKECRFFSQMPGNFLGGEVAAFQNDVITNIKDYMALFEGNETKMKGDVSNDYLFYYRQSVKNIKKYISDNDVKIIIILRNPVDRAYSNYLHSVRLLSEPLTFEQAIIHEPYRKKMNYAWPFLYVETGMYFCQVKHYLENFKHVRVFLYEDLSNKSFPAELFDFLGVDADAMEMDLYERYNVATVPRYPIISKLLYNLSKTNISRSFVPTGFKRLVKNSLEAVNKREPPPIKKQTRLYLQNIFRQDIEMLQQLIGRDLSVWMDGTSTDS